MGNRGTKVSWNRVSLAPNLAITGAAMSSFAGNSEREDPLTDTKEIIDEDATLTRYLVVSQVRALIEANQDKTAAIKTVAGRVHLGRDHRSRRYGERTLWRWFADWQAHGIQGLAQTSRQPRDSGLPSKFLALVEEQKEMYPRFRSRNSSVWHEPVASSAKRNPSIVRRFGDTADERTFLPSDGSRVNEIGNGPGGIQGACSVCSPTANTFVPDRLGRNE